VKARLCKSVPVDHAWIEKDEPKRPSSLESSVGVGEVEVWRCSSLSLSTRIESTQTQIRGIDQPLASDLGVELCSLINFSGKGDLINASMGRGHELVTRRDDAAMPGDIRNRLSLGLFRRGLKDSRRSLN
jgi:hypothetical protein